ncbi:hypothetical protein BOO69_07315 [Sulfitobacter alexandrii]|uniref:Uncharacterized protein n=1 Tax=Sulfitobacter alexandrii TaxID=1917485 RepID=A0A1J0WGI9_9RHOB|nr:hypothetical protein [Sulfitobacter alexandrii]APE43246.1 hypothetical protein BOO69_07315 [Sulfitobacter alexandrii]
MPVFKVQTEGLGDEEAAALVADIEALNAAFVDDARRDLASIALRLVADIVRGQSGEDAKPMTLTAEERENLAGFGVTQLEPMTAAEKLASSPVQDGLKSRAEMLATAVPLEEAAEHMGCSVEAVQQRIARGTLVTVERPTDGVVTVPVFQLAQDGELPHWERLMEYVRGKPSALTVHRMMTLPQDETDGMPPRDWLIAGGAPGPVAVLMAGL